jgi:hypothetical protein
LQIANCKLKTGNYAAEPAAPVRNFPNLQFAIFQFAIHLLLPTAIAVGGILWLIAASASTWWSSALRSPLGIACGAVMAGSALLLQATLTALWRLCPRPPRPLVADRRGMAVLEFALLFPVALAVVLLMVQTAMLMAGNLMVHYSAFAATRAAVVCVPMDLTAAGEPPNVVLRDNNNSAKLAWIRRAAVLAVAPACAGGPVDHAVSANGIWQQRLAAFFSGQGSPSWLSRRSMDLMVAYADAHTQVSLAAPAGIPPADGDDGRLDGVFDNGSSVTPYGPVEDLSVTVRHELILPVPYANRLFGHRLAGWPGQWAVQIAATYTLVNQGRYDNITPEYISGAPNELLLPR